MSFNVRKVTNRDIRSYYTHAAIDYWAAWLNGRNLAMHFGYQEDNTMGHSASLTNATGVLADIADVSAGDRVLDAGCGLGGTGMWLASRRRARVTGIALGADQVGSARDEAVRRAVSHRTQFLVADFTVLPFVEKSFDVVWAQESLCHATEKEAFFAEAARVLASNGRLVIADFMLRRRSISGPDQKLLDEWLDGWKLPDLWTAGQHANAAHAARLSDIRIQDVTRCTLPSHRRLYQRARRALPLALLLRLTGVRDRLQNGNFVGALRQYETLRKDCWFYGIMSARKP
jgi:cyclopropane fatty-acyl-phospholipid synthase-like methyltransferase